MIAQLQVFGFVKEKINYLSILARDLGRSIGELADLQFSDEGPEELSDLDIAEFLGSMEALERDETLGGDAAYWMPHNAYAAMLQSNLDTYYRVNQSVMPEDSDINPVGLESYDRFRFGETLREDPINSKNVLQGLGQKLKKAFRLNRKDPRWVLVLQAKAIKRRKGRAPFPDNSATTTTIAANSRVLLVGDWASGVPEAVDLAKTMWNRYLQPQLGILNLHVIHLGDVYYAGLRDDYRDRFAPYWPVPPGYENRVSSWCLAGNHDMYSGGHGFFEMLKDTRFAAQNQAAYFLLENDHWQVFGLDSSFDPRDYKGDIGELYGEQAVWVARKRDAAPNKRCLMLTHHQPFCAYSVIEENLARRLRPIVNARQIDVWFWGHEHLCAVYHPFGNIQYPVLLGHGGFPQKPKPRHFGGPPVKYEWLATAPSGDVRFGFAVLDFKDSQIDVQLVDQSGTLQHRFLVS